MLFNLIFIIINIIIFVKPAFIIELHFLIYFNIFYGFFSYFYI